MCGLFELLKNFQFLMAQRTEGSLCCETSRMLKICILDGCQEHEFISVLEAKIKPSFIHTLKNVVLSLDKNIASRTSCVSSREVCETSRMLKSCILDGRQEHEFISVLEAKIKPLHIYIKICGFIFGRKNLNTLSRKEHYGKNKINND